MSIKEKVFTECKAKAEQDWRWYKNMVDYAIDFTLEEVNKEIEAFGAKVVAQYSVLGPFDFVNIVEAPDNEAIVRVSMELGSRGTVKIMSMPAIPIENLLAIAKKK